jgi:hypothetical protein
MVNTSSSVGDFGNSATAPLYVGGIPVADVLTTLPKIIAPSQQVSADNRFWSSPARPPQDTHDDGIIIELARKKQINYISVDLPHLPFHIYFHYWDDSAKKWKEFTPPGKSGVVRVYIDGAVPAVIGPAAAYQAHQNPSHYGAGHWVHYDLDLAPVITSKIRVEGTRAFDNATRNLPLTPGGKSASYSFGVRNLDFGWRVRSKNDIPFTGRDPDIMTQRESFTQVLDIMGSPVELAVRENRASDLLRGSVWKCEAMPVSYAVVNFYVDARDAFGNPQVIDRFNVTPLNSGPSLNLYYSTQVPDSDFTASDSPIVFPSLDVSGELLPVVQPSGILFRDAISYLDVSNQVPQWDPTRPWWMGVAFQPQYSSDIAEPFVVLDTGSMQLAWNGEFFQFTYNGGVLEEQPFSFDQNTLLHAVISFDGNQLSLWMPEGLGVPSVPTSMIGITSSGIRFGAELGDTDAPVIAHGNYRLTAFVLKAENVTFETDDNHQLVIPDGPQGFVNDSATYLNKPLYHADDDHSTDNALVRFLPTFCTSGDTGINPYGFVGGPGDIYGEIVWTPVTRDYKLRAGMLQFPPTEACFFKFEFTNLTPEPYDTFQPITRTVKTFSSAATTPTTSPNKQGETSSANQSSGLIALSAAAPTVAQYADTPARSAPSQTDVTPTEALTATDGGVQQKLDAMGSLYRFASWQPSTAAPRYPQTSQHLYEEVDLAHSKRIAYFVGLSALEMYRVDYTSSDDTEQYIEQFDDTANIDPDYLQQEVVLGTTNVVTNPSFENGITGHTLYTNGTATAGAITAVVDSKPLYRTHTLSVTATTLGSTTSDRVGFQETFNSLDFTNSIAYSIYSRQQTGSATLRLNVEYYNSGASFLSSDSRSFTPAESLSEVYNANTSFEADTSGWTAFGGTLARTTAQQHAGVASALFTPDGTTATVGFKSDLIPVTPGLIYRARGWIRMTVSATPGINVNWYDVNKTYLSTSAGSVSVTANTWTFTQHDFTAPAGAVYASIVPTQTGTPPSSQIMYVDQVEFLQVFSYWTRCSAVLLPAATTASVKVYWWLEAGGSAAVDYRFDGYQVENLRLTDYTDGSIPGSAWNGTADASTSTRTAIDIEPWTWDGDKLVTAGGTVLANPLMTQSKTFSSQRRLRGIQFATQQSGSVQLLADPDFTDTTMTNWVATGDVIEMGLSEDFNSTLGSTLKITRSSAVNTWAELKAAYPSWGAIQAAAVPPAYVSYGQLEGDTGAVGFGGVQLRDPVQVSQSGRVYAAARVYTTSALQGPLHLQILGYNGDLLAEETQDVQSGHIVEFYVGYTVGSATSVSNTWGSIMQRSPAPTYGSLGIATGSGTSGTWAAMTDTAITDASQLKVQLIQEGPNEDTWYVDSLALFEDPILWEFSNDQGTSWWPALDIRNNPSGVLIFPNSLTPVATDPRGLKWRVTGFRPNLHISALNIRPWYAETVFGIPHREPGVSGGPNIQPTDHYPPIEDDPMFKQWDLPIPQDWFFTYRQLLALEHAEVPTTPVTVPTVFANLNAFLVDPTQIPTPPAYLDQYGDGYGDPYGVPNTTGGVYITTYDPANEY